MSKRETITVKTTIDAWIDKVWECWTKPEHIERWNHASDDWFTSKATNDLTKGGKFTYRMEAKDGSFGFDFSGTYDEIKQKESLSYILEDDRKVSILFDDEEGQIHITEIFEAENENPVKMQRDGWQAILDNFKKYVEEK